MKKPSCSAKRGERRENREIFLEKSPEFRVRTRQDEKKSGLHRAKNESDSSKNRPKTDLKRGKARKTEILERKRRGGGEAKKWAFTADFAML